MYRTIVGRNLQFRLKCTVFACRNCKFRPTLENIVSDRLIVSFIINKKGAINNVQILKSMDPNIDQQIISITKALPLFIPGRIRNKAVNIKMIIPIRFHFDY